MEALQTSQHRTGRCWESPGATEMLLHPQHPVYVLHRRTTNLTHLHNRTARTTKSIHPRVVEGSGERRRGGQRHREKNKASSPSRKRGWQMLGSSCRETSGPCSLIGVKTPHPGFGKMLPYLHQSQNSQLLREEGICRGPLAGVGPASRVGR